MTDAAWMEGAVRAVGWTLVFSMWQGVLIVGVVALLLRALRSASAETRYLVACAGLLLMASAWVGTACIWGAASRPIAVGGGADTGGPSQRAGTGPRRSVRHDASRPYPAGVSIRSGRRGRAAVAAAARPARAVAGAGVARRRRRVSVRLGVGWWDTTAAGDGTNRRDAGLAGTGGAALESPRHPPDRTGGAVVPVDVPATMVAPSAGARAGQRLRRLTPAQLEAVLVHELAHVRRHDYAVNVLQSAVETVLFYHPACWWLTRRIRPSASTAATTSRWPCAATASSTPRRSPTWSRSAAAHHSPSPPPTVPAGAHPADSGRRDGQTTPRGLAAALLPSTMLTLTLAMCRPRAARLSALVQSAVPTAGRTVPLDEGILQGRVVETGSARPVREAAIEVVRQGGGVGEPGPTTTGATRCGGYTRALARPSGPGIRRRPLRSGETAVMEVSERRSMCAADA